MGVAGLAALSFGMMVGAGIFNIPQNMAVAAGSGALLISWLVTAIGMLLLVYTFKILAVSHPELNSGIYQYARAGFGNFMGFNMAWGYWLSAAFANVAYAVMLSDTCGSFLPVLLTHGWPMVGFGTCLIWLFYLIALLGLRTAKVLTVILALVKFSTIGMIIILLGLNFSYGTFSLNGLTDMTGLGTQVRGTMLVTLWCFIGIEGAAIMSEHARRESDIGKASVLGFGGAWCLYLLVAMFSYGVMSRAELAGLENPSVAYVLLEICGPAAYWMVVAAVIIALGGGWLAWTLVCAEVPYTASKAGIMPRRFGQLSKRGMPVFGLTVSSIVMTLFLLLVMTADDVYTTALDVTGMMILPCYLLSGIYLSRKADNRMHRMTGVACTLFCMWMIYAGGIGLFLQTSIFYIAGTGFYIKARRERGLRVLNRRETVMLGILVSVALLTVCL